jgi:hypothetical protein
MAWGNGDLVISGWYGYFTYQKNYTKWLPLYKICMEMQIGFRKFGRCSRSCCFLSPLRWAVALPLHRRRQSPPCCRSLWHPDWRATVLVSTPRLLYHRARRELGRGIGCCLPYTAPPQVDGNLPLIECVRCLSTFVHASGSYSIFLDGGLVEEPGTGTTVRHTLHPLPSIVLSYSLGCYSLYISTHPPTHDEFCYLFIFLHRQVLVQGLPTFPLE